MKTKLKDQCQELLEYAEIDNTEWGEVIRLLIQLLKYKPFVSKQLYELIEEELADEHKYVKRNCRIVEETKTITQTVKSLEWAH